jgi:hypothetical protein
MKTRTFRHFPLWGAPLDAALVVAGTSSGVGDPTSGDIYVATSRARDP